MWLKSLMLGVVASGLMGLQALAADAPAGKGAESKRTAYVSAASIDFAKELELSFPSLSGLGGRIEEARNAPDPVGLAAAAKELAALEKVSGKMASIKSEDLSKEAIELAKRRFSATELKLVAAILGDEAGSLATTVEKATKAETLAKAAKDSGEKSKGIQRRLHVDNHSGHWIAVYLDGNYVGRVAPYGDGYMYIGQGAYEDTYLDARDGHGGSYHLVVDVPVGDFTWSLY